MKFLPDTHRVGKIVCSNYTSYFVWDDSKCNYLENKINGPGIEVTVVNPTTRYLYSYEFPTYEKFLNPSKFIHMHGICLGSIVTEQLPLFHIHQTYPFYRRMFSNKNFDNYIMALVGVSVLDYRYRFNIGIGLDRSQSKTVQHLSRLFEEIAIAPPPVNLVLNKEDEDHDYEKWGIEIDLEKIIYIDENYLYIGNETSRYEIMKIITGNKHLPRFWKQQELNIDLTTSSCDNQMVLF